MFKKKFTVGVTIMDKVFYFDTCAQRWQLFLQFCIKFVAKTLLNFFCCFFFSPKCGKAISTLQISNFRHLFFWVCLFVSIKSNQGRYNRTKKCREPAVKAWCFFPAVSAWHVGKSTTWQHGIFCHSDVIQRKSWLRFFFFCDYPLNDSNN